MDVYDKIMECLERFPVRVEWREIGEGWSGDYDPDDPDDEELLRFYVRGHIPSIKALSYQENEADEFGWADLQDGSYCTRFPVSATPEQRELALRFIMDKVYPAVFDDTYDDVCERISWIDLSWLDDDNKQEFNYLNNT